VEKIPLKNNVDSKFRILETLVTSVVALHWVRNMYAVRVLLEPKTYSLQLIPVHQKHCGVRTDNYSEAIQETKRQSPIYLKKKIPA